MCFPSVPLLMKNLPQFTSTHWYLGTCGRWLFSWRSRRTFGIELRSWTSRVRCANRGSWHFKATIIYSLGQICGQRLIEQNCRGQRLRLGRWMLLSRKQLDSSVGFSGRRHDQSRQHQLRGGTLVYTDAVLSAILIVKKCSLHKWSKIGFWTFGFTINR